MLPRIRGRHRPTISELHPPEGAEHDRQPKGALHILDNEEPFRYLELRGDTTVEPDDDYAFADRLGSKYGGLDLRNMDRPGERRTMVKITVNRVRAVDMRKPGTVGSSLNR